MNENQEKMMMLNEEIIDSWNNLDDMIDNWKKILIDMSLVPEDISDNLLCEYVLTNHSATIIMLLKHNIPSKYDLGIITAASKSKSRRWTANQIMRLYSARKVQ